MSKDFLNKIGFIFLLLVFPSLAFANVVWPGLILAQRMALWAIPAGLIIETIILNFVMKKPLAKAFGIVLVVNIFSTVIGALGTAIGGLAWEASVGIAFYRVLNIGTFNPATWIFTVGIAAYLSYFFECKALKWFFKISLEKKEKRLFLVANIVSTLVAFASIFIVSPF
jgi:hypothetical protein